MTDKAIYRPTYAASWALVIGINDYRVAPQLGYARHDAEGFATTLKSRFGFANESVTVLLDEQATRANILQSYLSFASPCVNDDDRVIVFFAGHGCTRTGKRGEIGYLIPVDGDPDHLTTLIRWDDLTRNGELIAAKHVLFIMDASYGGLALHRGVPRGSARFLRDMLQRYSRQVLTAGKADETVADSGGPRPSHSIFTGHLLDALDGAAADPNGIISANAVMAYVFDHVSKDPHSRQSPHFGFFDGDGDFIFTAPDLTSAQMTNGSSNDTLLQLPAGAPVVSEIGDLSSLITTTKDYLSDAKYKIRLDDLVAAEIRSGSYNVREDEFPVQTETVTPEAIAERLRKYEGALSRLSVLIILIARWGGPEHQQLLSRIIARLTDGTEVRSGRTAWVELRWYPIMLLIYSGGISALSTNNYSSLATLLTTPVKNYREGTVMQAAVIATVKSILEVDRLGLFKTLPDHDRLYVPRSEYMFKRLQPELEDLLFLGNSYEDLFDRFEMLYALSFADKTTRDLTQVWAPPGRFAWKHQRGNSPYDALVEEAKQQDSSWPPLTAGLFERSPERFKAIAGAYRTQWLDKLQWY